MILIMVMSFTYVCGYVQSQKEGSQREEDGSCSPNILEAERNHKYHTHVTSSELLWFFVMALHERFDGDDTDNADYLSLN